jgi:hypothetical protein
MYVCVGQKMVGSEKQSGGLDPVDAVKEAERILKSGVEKIPAYLNVCKGGSYFANDLCEVIFPTRNTHINLSLGCVGPAELFDFMDRAPDKMLPESDFERLLTAYYNFGRQKERAWKVAEEVLGK